MMKPPNVEVLGSLLSAALKDGGSSISGGLAEQRYAPLVTLQAGQPGVTPLFCVPGAGASVANFMDLIGYLDTQVPVLGFQPRGLDGLLVPHTTVSAIVECYLQALQTSSPSGPVHLFGHSFGGWAVFELATRLRSAGRAIASLTIVDSDAPSVNPLFSQHYRHSDVIQKWIETFEMALDGPIGVVTEEFELRSVADQFAIIHAHLVQAGLLPKKSNPEILRGPLNAFAAALRAAYTPNSSYPFPVNLVLVDDQRLDEISNRKRKETSARGWRRWAPELNVFNAPGNHMTVLKPPHVQTLALWLRSVFQKAI
jgi:thioesterase domain-containing protein